MNPFDRHILLFINELAQKSWFFDKSILYLSEFALLKGGIVLAILWSLWFAYEKEGTAEDAQRTIIMTMIGAIMAILISRLLANGLPFRPRPINNLELAFRIPFGVKPTESICWSSFPSDHAALFSALSTGIFIISSRIGLLVVGYILLFILFPRLYLGLHYPTDILAGATIGVLAVLVANSRKIKEQVAQVIFPFRKSHPCLFYGILFLFMYQTAVLFHDIRTFGKLASDVILGVRGIPR